MAKVRKLLAELLDRLSTCKYCRHSVQVAECTCNSAECACSAIADGQPRRTP